MSLDLRMTKQLSKFLSVHFLSIIAFSNQQIVSALFSLQGLLKTLSINFATAELSYLHHHLNYLVLMLMLI